MENKNVIRNHLLKNHLPSNFVSLKMMEHDERIIKLENKVRLLTCLMSQSKQNTGYINDQHIFILDNMPTEKVVTLNQIKFPTGMAERTCRKYIETLIIYSYVKRLSSGRWSQYIKLKNISDVK